MEKLPLHVKVSYGIGAVGKDLVYSLAAGYVLYYYNVVLGLSATFIGVILLVARVFDAANDPFMGVVVAKTKSKWGRFRPWIFSGTILNAVVLYALFAVPQNIKGAGLMVFFSVVYILWGVTYTIMDIPYWSMIPAICENTKQRENLSVVGRSCAGVGAALISILTMKCIPLLGGATEQYDGDYRAGFKWFALIIAVFFVISAIITCIGVKEKTESNIETVSIKQMFKALFSNDQAIAVVVTIILVNTALYTTSNLLLYFFQFDIGAGNSAWNDAYVLFNTFGGGMQIIAMMLFFPLIRLVLKATDVFKLGLGMAIFGYIILLFLAFNGATSVYILFIPAFFIFSANGLLTVLLTLFLADSVDYGELKNGHREESVIFSMQTFVVKLASGLAALIVGIGLDIINLDKEATAQAAETVLGLRFIMSVVPMLGLIAALILFIKKYKLTEDKVKEITETLVARRAEKQNSSKIEQQ